MKKHIIFSVVMSVTLLFSVFAYGMERMGEPENRPHIIFEKYVVEYVVKADGISFYIFDNLHGPVSMKKMSGKVALSFPDGSEKTVSVLYSEKKEALTASFNLQGVSGFKARITLDYGREKIEFGFQHPDAE